MTSTKAFLAGIMFVATMALLFGGCPAQMPTPGPEGPEGPAGPAGSMGAIGTMGTMGVDGTLRVYGDGSAGARTISANENWTGANPAGANDVANTQFTDFTVNNGVTLIVPSGTIIRCTGTFTNNTSGTIVVATGSVGGFRNSPDPSSQGLEESIAHPGIGRRSAGSGEIGNNMFSQQSQGFGGQGVDKLTARFFLRPGPNAGGGGGPSLNGSGSDGGGSLVVMAQGTLVNNGTITANGDSLGGGSGGGGAGGILILASRTSVTNGAAAVLRCNGGTGANSTITTGACGGGGGGIINLLAPTVTGGGTVEVNGGNAGNTMTAVSNPSRAGGAGGGACGGKGGSGANVISDAGAQSLETGGNAGYVFLSQFDPTSVL